jgi:hypothetical protein
MNLLQNLDLRIAKGITTIFMIGDHTTGRKSCVDSVTCYPTGSYPPLPIINYTL